MTEFFRNTLAPWQWGLLALVPPTIIALYFLKLRRQPLEVPSTYLWRRSIEDLHVNSLWQRLRRNLLMFLQLLLVALAILALLRPGWQGSRLEGQRFVLLVDNSASMAATDANDASSRLEEAKRLAEDVVNQMDSDMTAMVISYADKPQVVQEFTSNRRLLRERIASIQPTARGTDLAAALELANGLANAGRATREGGSDDQAAAAESPPATAYIFSDGRFEDVKDISINKLNPVYVPVGSLFAQNLAITTIAARRNEERPERQEAFVQVANFTDETQPVVVELSLDGNFLDAAKVEVPAGETRGVVFPLAEGAVGGLSARLQYKLDGGSQDALRQDDIGYAALNPASAGHVLVVSAGDVPLATTLGTERAKRLASSMIVPPATLASPEYQREAENGGYDLIIYDRCAPEQLPRANTVFIGRLPPGPAWRGHEDASGGEDAASRPARLVGPQIVDWDRASPLLAHVDFGDVVIADSLLVQPPAGGTVLIESTAGPIAAIAPRNTYQDVVLGFEIVGVDKDGARTANTNWPIRTSFPTFWLNVLEYLSSHGEQQETMAVRPGQSIELNPPAKSQPLTVVDPDGQETTIVPSARETFPFNRTEKPGVYQVRQGEEVVERFAVNLFDRAESDIAVRPTQDPASQTARPADVRIGHVDIAAATERTPARQELWKVLLACALFVLVLEWYIYNRRVYL